MYPDFCLASHTAFCSLLLLRTLHCMLILRAISPMLINGIQKGQAILVLEQVISLIKI